MKVSRRSVLKGGAALAAAGVSSSILGPNIAQAQSTGLKITVDVVICGCGAAGLAAAVRARELGLSVIVLEAMHHIGGRAIVNSGNIPIGGGTPAQMLANIPDTPDILYRDLTDWTIVQANGFPSYRYNDHEVIRAYANYNTGLQDFLSRNGVVYTRTTPDNVGGNEVGNSFNRMMHSALLKYESARTGLVGSGSGATTSEGPGFVYPLYNSAVAKGAKILLNCRLLTLDRASGAGGVAGVTASYNGSTIQLQALKGVLIATGGGQGNVNYRQMFDPRLGPEYISVAGEPWSFQDASGIFAGMNVGAAIAGAYNHMAEIGTNVTKAGKVGTQHNYTFLNWGLQSKPFLEGQVKATGITVNFQDGILIKAKPGNDQNLRFYDETAGQFGTNSAGQIPSYTQWDYRNLTKITYNPTSQGFLDAALAGPGDGFNGGGPLWFIFDDAARARRNYNVAPPVVDPNGFFFSANTLEELAAKIVMPQQRIPVSPTSLSATVTRYNNFVGVADADFGKPTPQFRIQTGPFYAAWATPTLHDARSGLRINGKREVLDLSGKVIPGLYAAGEAAGGFSQHGAGRAMTDALIAMANASVRVV
jgi:hypothetical protein